MIDLVHLRDLAILGVLAAVVSAAVVLARRMARQVEIAQAAREALAHEQEQLRESRDRVAAQARMLEAQNDALLLSRDQVAAQARELEAANAALREAVRVREEVERWS